MSSLPGQHLDASAQRPSPFFLLVKPRRLRARHTVRIETSRRSLSRYSRAHSPGFSATIFLSLSRCFWVRRNLGPRFSFSRTTMDPVSRNRFIIRLTKAGLTLKRFATWQPDSPARQASNILIFKSIENTAGPSWTLEKATAAVYPSIQYGNVNAAL